MAQAIDHLPLTLQETVEKVLKNNISISVASYSSKFNEQSIFENEAEFDPTFGLELLLYKYRPVRTRATPTNISFFFMCLL